MMKISILSCGLHSNKYGMRTKFVCLSLSFPTYYIDSLRTRSLSELCYGYETAKATHILDAVKRECFHCWISAQQEPRKRAQTKRGRRACRPM